MHNIKDVLDFVQGNTFVGLDTEIPVTLAGGKGNPQQGRVTKVTRGSKVQIFCNKNGSSYENAVRRRLAVQLRNEALEQVHATLKDVPTDFPEDEVNRLVGSVEDYIHKADYLGKTQDLFQLKPRKWGERIPNSPFVRHIKANDVHPNYYMEVIFLASGESSYLLDGQHIDEANIVGLKKTELREGPEVQGGLNKENQVIVRSYAVDSIRAIRAGGVEFKGKFFYA